MTYINIFHMASFSRSGETLMLRCLNANPNIRVLHNLRKKDNPEDLKLFRHLNKRPDYIIEHTDKCFQDVDLNGAQNLILKNAVWEHQFPFRGFILVRNPLAVFKSFGIYNEPDYGYKLRREQFNRWLQDIDPLLIPALDDPDNVTAFCLLYNRKMYKLSTMLHLPIVHYEYFVQNPEYFLMMLCNHFGVKYENDMLDSYKFYEKGDIGHGNIELWKPIHASSKEKYITLPNNIKAKICGLTHPTMEAFGYVYDGERVHIKENFDDRFDRYRPKASSNPEISSINN